MSSSAGQKGRERLQFEVGEEQKSRYTYWQKGGRKYLQRIQTKR